jgi:hypothetical protein
VGDILNYRDTSKIQSSFRSELENLLRDVAMRPLVILKQLLSSVAVMGEN